MSEEKVVRVFDLDGLWLALVVLTFILCAFKCSGVVLWGPNEPKDPEKRCSEASP